VDSKSANLGIHPSLKFLNSRRGSVICREAQPVQTRHAPANKVGYANNRIVDALNIIAMYRTFNIRFLCQVSDVG
jgi:hypothetical protein